MKFNKNWLIPIALTAAAGAAVLQNNFASAPAPSIATAVDKAPIVAVTDTPAYEGCAYSWAYHEAPELAEKVSSLVTELNPKAEGQAFLFGEDCVYADGSSEFHALETSFYVRLPVEDLTDTGAFGDWMAQVMPVILDIPRAEIGGNYGFVEFWFYLDETQQVIARVPIQIYIEQAQGLDGAELYNLFSGPIPY